MSQFATKVAKGIISSYVEALPQMHASDNIPEKAAICPECGTTFVAERIRACLFCNYREDRVNKITQATTLQDEM